MDKEICHVTVQGMVVLFGMELYLLSIFQAAKAWPPVGFGCNIKLHTVFQLTANHTSPCCLLLLQFFEEENAKWERAFWLRMPNAFALAKIVCEAALGFSWQGCLWQQKWKSNMACVPMHQSRMAKGENLLMSERNGWPTVLLLSSICRKYDEEVCCDGHGTSMVVEAWWKHVLFAHSLATWQCLCFCWFF